MKGILSLNKTEIFVMLQKLKIIQEEIKITISLINRAWL